MTLSLSKSFEWKNSPDNFYQGYFLWLFYFIFLMHRLTQPTRFHIIRLSCCLNRIKRGLKMLLKPYRVVLIASFLLLNIPITNLENPYSALMHLILCRDKIYRGISNDVDCSGEYPHSSMANAT